jgi:hypothetical protein
VKVVRKQAGVRRPHDYNQHMTKRDVAHPVCITGMHRSGTSMLANVLRMGGLYLGPERALVATRVGNPDGHWENRKLVALNDEVLAQLGGWWAEPPTMRASARLTLLSAQKKKAKQLLNEFAGHSWWGWKDPRNCLTLPFWLDLVPQARVVICLRHPLEVVRSLERRSYEIVRTNWPRLYSSRAGLQLWRTLDRATGGLRLRPRNFFSAEHWLALWETYNRRVLEFTNPERRLITHHEAFFTRPRAEFERVLTFLGMPCSKDVIERCVAVVSTELRHVRLAPRDLIEAAASAEVLALYARLCEEADVSTEV